MTLPDWYRKSIFRNNSGGLNAFDCDSLTLMMYYGSAGHIVERIESLMTHLTTPSTIAVNINPETIDPHISYGDFNSLVEMFPSIQTKHLQLIGLSAYESIVILN